MNEQILALLSQVQSGAMSPTEAQRRYDLMLQPPVPVDATASADTPNNRAKAAVNDSMLCDERSIECLTPIEDPAYRLFVFLPFGFGNRSISWAWKQAFADVVDLEVWIMAASDIEDWSTLVSQLTARMASLCDRPFIVYGHSMGGIVAYECVVELERSYGRSPLLFIPSSVPPPTIFERLKKVPPVSEIAAGMDMERCRHILEENHIILPPSSGVRSITDSALRCDIELMKSYSHRHSDRALSCPILALQANNDVLVQDAVSLSLWHQHTKKGFLLEEVEGTHLFFTNPPMSFFDKIKQSFHGPTFSESPLLRAGVYRLVDFYAGTEEVHSFPFGLSPKGYLIYQNDGTMAAHLWSDRCPKPEDVSAESEAGNEEMLGKMLTYLSYTGRYRARENIVEHFVLASSDPNFDNDNLIRYYEQTNATLSLRTAPLTTQAARQSKSCTYAKLTWERLPAVGNCAGPSPIGSWSVSDYREDETTPLGSAPVGQLLLTEDGYFSLLAARSNRARPRLHNLMLADDEELVQAFVSCRSLCGRFAMQDDGKLIFYIDEGIFDRRAECLSIQCESLSQRFSIDLVPVALDGKDTSIAIKRGVPRMETGSEMERATKYPNSILAFETTDALLRRRQA